MITQDKLIGNSLIQSSYNYFCECLENFKEEQPSFEYTITYGTNSNEATIEKSNIFNFVFYNGIPELIPSHWIDIDGETMKLYAGYLDVAVSVLNPIPVNYNEDFTIETAESISYSDDLEFQEQFNELSDETSDRIEYGIRLLEAFALFMRRKGVLVDNFKFTSDCAVPTPDGIFETGMYRLQTTLDIQLKFALQNKIGQSLVDGEDLKVWIKVGENGDYKEIYNVLDFDIKSTIIEKTYPLFDRATTNTTPNQMSRSLTINCPEFTFGGNKVIRDIIDTGDLEKIGDCYIKFWNGKTYKEFSCVPCDLDYPMLMDKFNGETIVFAITSDILEVTE